MLPFLRSPLRSWRVHGGVEIVTEMITMTVTVVEAKVMIMIVTVIIMQLYPILKSIQIYSIPP